MPHHDPRKRLLIIAVNPGAFVSVAARLLLTGCYLWRLRATNLLWCELKCSSAVHDAAVHGQQLPQITEIASPVDRSQFYLFSPRKLFMFYYVTAPQRLIQLTEEDGWCWFVWDRSQPPKIFEKKKKKRGCEVNTGRKNNDDVHERGQKWRFVTCPSVA